MKKLLVVIFICSLVFSCVKTPPEESVCVTYQPDAYSWICEVSNKHGYSPEDLEGVVLDVIALRAIMDKNWDDEKQDQVVNYTRKLDSYADNPAMTFTDMITDIELDAQKSALLLSIISRRLPWFNNSMVIPAKDRYMLHAHFRHIREIFGVYDK